MNPGTNPQVDPITATIDEALRALASHGGDLLDEANRLGTILWSPPRVVIAGRLKAGKSTLVNALVGQRIAATAAGECTNAVSVFHNGQPARAEVVGLDGQRHRQPLEHGVLMELGRPVNEVAYVDRFLPSAAIQNITLIDTPGIATLTVENQQATQRALIDGYDQTRNASVDADAAIFLFDSSPRTDERDFIAQLGFTPLNTIGVLARADGFGEGALGARDPLEHAQAYSRVLEGRIASLTKHVFPLSGLLAESARTGQVTEHLARLVSGLSSLPREDLIEELETDTPRHMTVEARDLALDLLGEYGVLHGAGAAAQGAVALNDWLQRCSGIQHLENAIYGQLLRFATYQRANRMLRELDTLAYNHPSFNQIRHIRDTLAAQPAMAQVLLFNSYRGVLQNSSKSRLIPVLESMLMGSTPQEWLGLAPDATITTTLERGKYLLGELQQLGLVNLSAAEDDARMHLIFTIQTIMRSLQH